MRKLMNVTSVIISVISIMLLANSSSSAQKLDKRITIQAQAMGQSTQLGRTFGVTLLIEEYSTEADKTALLEAFSQKGNEGLVNALSKMKSKGRISVTGTLGYDVSYIRQWKQPDGTTMLRAVTDRPIRIGEAWSDSRSMDFNLSALEIIFSPDKKKNTGIMYPLSQLKMNKENQIELELYQNPWKLVNIMQR
jgi:hypothetical protein